MVVSNRELVNTLFSTSFNTLITPITCYNNNIDIEVDILRGMSVSSSVNISRKMSAHSSISSISYIERMEAQSKDFS